MFLIQSNLSCSELYLLFPLPTRLLPGTVGVCGVAKAQLSGGGERLSLEEPLNHNELGTFIVRSSL